VNNVPILYCLCVPYLLYALVMLIRHYRGK